jgi:hypothetical protein
MEEQKKRIEGRYHESHEDKLEKMAEVETGERGIGKEKETHPKKETPNTPLTTILTIINTMCPTRATQI